MNTDEHPRKESDMVDLDEEVANLETIQVGGRTLVRSEEGFRGKKAVQVAGMLEIIQKDPSEAHELEDLCRQVEQKYSQDVVAAFMAMEMLEAISVFKDGKKTYIRWE